MVANPTLVFEQNYFQAFADKLIVFPNADKIPLGKLHIDRNKVTERERERERERVEREREEREEREEAQIHSIFLSDPARKHGRVNLIRSTQLEAQATLSRKV